MRKLLLLAAFLFLCGSLHAQTPTFVQSANCSNNLGNSTDSLTCEFPNNSLANNLIVVAFQIGSGSGGTITVTDNNSNTYSSGKTLDDGSQVENIYYKAGAGSGVHTITLSFSSSATFTSLAVAEFYNVATSSPVDITCSRTATSTSVTCNSMTTTVDNDLIVQYAAQDADGVNTTWTQGSSPWRLWAKDFYNAQAAQYQVQTTHGAINPTMTQGSSKKYGSVGVAFKAASAGTAPSAGIRFLAVHHNAAPNGAANTNTLGAPCDTGANLIIVAAIGVLSHDITSVSDSGGNTWSNTGAAFGNSTSGDIQHYYAGNATCTTAETVTITTTGTDISGSTYNIYIVAGADTSPYDSTAGRQTSSGTQSVAANITGPSITPSTANGIVISTIGIDSNTANGVTSGRFLASLPSPVASPNPVDQNNGWAFQYNPSASATSFTWTFQGGAVNHWATVADAFKAPAGGGGGGGTPAITKRAKLDKVDD